MRAKEVKSNRAWREECEALRIEIARLKEDAARYNFLRSRNLDTITKGGVFAGMTPSNVILNGDDLDTEVDAARYEPNP